MIELKDVTKIYQFNKDTIKALQNINLTINRGEVVIIKGVSGSGKSTILSLIAGLSKPTSGEVIIDKKRISKMMDNFATDFRRDNIGFIFQKYNLISTLSVRDNIILPLIPTNPNLSDINKKVDEALKMFSMESKKNSLVKNLSGGEQQRVAIARANINNPNIIIADEPTANLDEMLSLHFIARLKELKDIGKTIIVATHDPLFFNLDFVDRVVDIYQGRLIR